MADVAMTQDDLCRVQAGLLANPGCSRVPQLVGRPWLDSGQLARLADRRAVAPNGDVTRHAGTGNEMIRIVREPWPQQELSLGTDRDKASLAVMLRSCAVAEGKPRRSSDCSVDLARPHGDQFSGPARQQELNLDHGPIRLDQGRQRRVDGLLDRRVEPARSHERLAPPLGQRLDGHEAKHQVRGNPLVLDRAAKDPGDDTGESVAAESGQPVGDEPVANGLELRGKNSLAGKLG